MSTLVLLLAAGATAYTVPVRGAHSAGVRIAPKKRLELKNTVAQQELSGCPLAGRAFFFASDAGSLLVFFCAGLACMQLACAKRGW